MEAKLMNQASEEVREGRPERILFTIPEAAHAWHLGKTTVWLGIQQGLIRATKMGRATRIAKSEIERVAVEGLGFTEAE
jgi:excisionase family DNA binding protein